MRYGDILREQELRNELYRIAELRDDLRADRSDVNIDRYYSAYYQTAFPLATRSLQLAVDELGDICKRQYHTMVMALSFHPEPHTLLIAAFKPKRLFLLCTEQSRNSTLKQMKHYAPELFELCDTVEVPFSDPGLSNVRSIINQAKQGCSGRLLVDVTGYNKASAVNLAFAAREAKECDIVYLSAQINSQQNNLRFLIDRQELYFWQGDQLDTEQILLQGAADKVSISLRNNRCRFRHLAADNGRFIETDGPQIDRAYTEPLLKKLQTPVIPDQAQLFKTALQFRDHIFPADIRKLLSEQIACDLLTLELKQSAAAIPWELLPSREDLPLGSGRLCRRSLSDCPVTGRAVTERALLLIGNPTGDRNLDHTGEAAAIRELCKKNDISLETVTGREATIHRISELLPRFGFLHFAGHTTEAGLQLADGVLTPGLISRFSAVPQFVLLNSCRSASVQLAAAFLQAGTRCYLGSRWDLKDSTAAAFAEPFYCGLFKHLSIREGLEEWRRTITAWWEPLNTVWYGEQNLL